MIYELITARQQGAPYSPKEFYLKCNEYGYVLGDIVWNIARAMDEGEEADVKQALYQYIIKQEYSLNILPYIKSVNWL